MNTTRVAGLLAATVLLGGVNAEVTDSLSPFRGLWFSEDKKAVFKAESCSQGLCATVVGLKPDKLNNACGVVLVVLDRWDPSNRNWHGTVLDPGSNRHYSAILEIGKNNAPKLKAKWAFLSFNEQWTKFSGTLSDHCGMR